MPATETAHTPGPYMLHDGRIWGQPQPNTLGRCLAVVASDVPQSEANGNLFAAAPDLLALLIELTNIEGPQPGNVEWANKVCAVIAKATGQGPTASLINHEQRAGRGVHFDVQETKQ